MKSNISPEGKMVVNPDIVAAINAYRPFPGPSPLVSSTGNRKDKSALVILRALMTLSAGNQGPSQVDSYLRFVRNTGLALQAKTTTPIAISKLITFLAVTYGVQIGSKADHNTDLALLRVMGGAGWFAAHASDPSAIVFTTPTDADERDWYEKHPLFTMIDEEVIEELTTPVDMSSHPEAAILAPTLVTHLVSLSPTNESPTAAIGQDQS
jgi:hypothetical protein